MHGRTWETPLLARYFFQGKIDGGGRRGLVLPELSKGTLSESDFLCLRLTLISSS